MNQRLCRNCHGYDHFSARCPHTPKWRRCFSCGKSGGKQNHRPTCESKWYDLTLRVPRNPDGSEMERDACITKMYGEFRDEQTRRQNAQRQRNEREQNTPREKNTVRELVDAEDAANWVNNGEESLMKNKKTEAADAKTDAEKSLVKAEKSEPGDTEMDDVESELNRLKALQVEASDKLKLIHDRIAEIEASREDDIPSPKFEWVGPRVFTRTVVNEFVFEPDVRPETTVHYKQLEKSQEDRSREPIAHAPEVFLRIKFDGVTKVLFAENSRDEIEVVNRPLRMTNGIQVRYLNGFLEMRGNPQEKSTFQIVSTGDPFRLLVAPRFAEINETFAMTADGLLIRAITPKGLPQITQHVFTIFGPPQRVVGVHYKNHRYRLAFKETGAVVTAESY